MSQLALWAMPPHRVNTTLKPSRFEDVLQEHIRSLQEALLALCATIDADLSVPYPLSKRLEIDKNLTWKAARIVQAKDPKEALKHLPGPSGRELLLRGFSRAGAPEYAIREVAESIVALESTVRRHTDDKETLELVLDGLPQQNGHRLEASRKLAFRGNSGVFGVQAKTRLTTTFLAPTEGESGRVDLVLVAGFHRFRRLREGTTWPILNLRRIGKGGESLFPKGAEPLDPEEADPAAPTLLRRFSSPELPPIRTRETSTHRIVEVPSGPVGNPGALDLVFGERHRSFASVYGDLEEDHGEHQTDLELPVEALLFDLFVHKDLPLAKEPRFHLLGRLGRPLAAHGLERDACALPIHEDLVAFERGSEAGKTSLMPNYSRILAATCAKAGWELDAFRVLRVTLSHPPVPSTAILSYPLARRE